MYQAYCGGTRAAPVEDNGGFGHCPSFETDERSSEKRPGGGMHTACLECGSVKALTNCGTHLSAPRPPAWPPRHPSGFQREVHHRKPGVPTPWGTVGISWGCCTTTGWLRKTGSYSHTALEATSQNKQEARENLTLPSLEGRMGEGTAWGCSRERDEGHAGEKRVHAGSWS